MSPTPLRVALGLHSLQLGGSQINTIDFASELRRRGHEVLVWAIEAGSYRATIEPIASAAGFTICRLPAEQRLTAQAHHVASLIGDFRADVVHVHHEHHWLGPVAALATLGHPRTAPVVTNWMMENTHYMPLYTTLVVGTPALRADAEAHRPGPVRVVEPPVNLARDIATAGEAGAFRSSVGGAPGDVLVVLVSRLDRDMKLDAARAAILALSHLSDTTVTLAIVGDGDAREELQELAQAVNSSLRRTAVSLVGALADPRPAYAAADVVLAMGGSALRAMAFSKPVIIQGLGTFASAYNEQSSAYFLEHGFFGAEPGANDGSRLASLIRELLDRDSREELGKLGRAHVERYFAVAVLTDRLEAVYREAVSHPRQPWQRWADAAYVSAYDFLGRRLSPKTRKAVRDRVPGLQGGKQTWTG